MYSCVRACVRARARVRACVCVCVCVGVHVNVCVLVFPHRHTYEYVCSCSYGKYTCEHITTKACTPTCVFSDKRSHEQCIATWVALLESFFLIHFFHLLIISCKDIVLVYVIS